MSAPEPQELDEGVSYGWARQALRPLEKADLHLYERALDLVAAAVREAWARRGKTTLDEVSPPRAQEVRRSPTFAGQVDELVWQFKNDPRSVCALCLQVVGEDGTEVVVRFAAPSQEMVAVLNDPKTTVGSRVEIIIRGPGGEAVAPAK